MKGSIFDYFRIVAALYRLRKYAKKERQARQVLTMKFGSNEEYGIATLGAIAMAKRQYYAAKEIKSISMDNSYDFDKISEWE